MPQTANISFNTKGTGHTSSTIYELTDPVYGSAVTCTPNNGTNNRVTYSQLEAGIQVSVVSTSAEYVLVTAINATCVGSTAQAWFSNAPAPTATPAPSPTPTNTSIAPTPTPTNTPNAPTPTPTNTSVAPTPTPTHTPTAQCLTYDVHNYDLVNTITFSYTDCNGVPDTEFTLNADSDYYICAQTVPVRIAGSNSYAVDTPGYVDALLCPDGSGTPAQPTPTPTNTPAPPAGASQYSLPSHTIYIPGSIVGTGNITFSGFSYASQIYAFVQTIANLSTTPVAGQWYNIARSSITVYDNNSTYTELGVIGVTYGSSQIKLESNGTGFVVTLSNVATISNPISATGQLWYKM